MRPRSSAPAAARALAAAAVFLAAHACTEERSASGGPWFTEVAAAAGVAFVHRSGHTDAHYYLPEVVAGGVALLDADEDGFLDLYLVQSGSLTAAAERPGNALFRNRRDGTFDDVSAASGAEIRAYGMGAATGDADDDGHVDLYVTNVGPNVLLAGAGDMTFRDVTGSAGVGDAGFGSSAAFLDCDVDGDLDLFVANYLIWSVETEKACSNGLGQRDYCAPALYNRPAVSVLYRNDGAGRFSDVSAAAGLTSSPSTALGVVCGDFTGDGRIDVFVSCDGRPNQLWVNEGGVRFEDEALPRGCAMDQDGIAKAGMGVAAADLDDDQDLDLVVLNLRGESSSLFRNEGDFFVDAAAVRGLGAVTRPFTGFGTGLVDFDDDGRLDLYEATGRVAADTDRHDTADPLASPDLLFRGKGDGGFEEALPRGGTQSALVHTGRGAAFGDLDNDGGIDVVVANRDAAPYVLHNSIAPRGNWLLVRVLDEHGRDAIGATVTLRIGARTLQRDVRTAYSYCSANDARVHFGLGRESADALEVRWTDGVNERFALDGVNRIVEVRRTDAASSPGH